MMYAMREGDARQHLLVTIGSPALCGEQSSAWSTGNIPARQFIGVPLCTECKAARARLKADEQAQRIRDEQAKVKTFWVKDGAQ